MPGTLFFVHGTGVRDDGFTATMALIREGARNNELDVADVRGTSWGGQLGVRLDRLSDVLPPQMSTRDIETVATAEEIAAAIWTQLLDDPLFELRVASAREPKTKPSTGLPGQTFPDQDAKVMLQRLSTTPPNLDGTGITASEVKIAADLLAVSPPLAAAAAAFGDANDPDFCAAMARAVVALVLNGHRFDAPGTGPAASYDGIARDRLVEAVSGTLSPVSTRGLGGWLMGKIEEIAKARATSAVRTRRAGLTGLSLPGIGDILLYQRRGADILACIAADLAACKPPIIAVGHSLGGIILVDLLSRSSAPAVDLLVTVGSQSPLFFIIDALDSLRLSDNRAPFTPWLNIYDPNDFLSFCAERAFSGQTGIHDRQVESKVPFPESHSAYWRQDEVYRIIKDFWPR
jgi:hypothetical protein